MPYFNRTGECNSAEHYMLPAAARMPDARMLIERRNYFVVHAPRQPGRTHHHLAPPVIRRGADSDA
ncbi:MAG: hypothetical protein FWE35_24830 [Streptosporangiales bacterium]|nr:hypothetical protein [Streptosporangiales bacterium]